MISCWLLIADCCQVLAVVWIMKLLPYRFSCAYVKGIPRNVCGLCSSVNACTSLKSEHILNFVTLLALLILCHLGHSASDCDGTSW